MFELDPNLKKSELVAAIEAAKAEYPALAEIDLKATKAEIIEAVQDAFLAITEANATVDGEAEAPMETVPPPAPEVEDAQEEPDPEPVFVEIPPDPSAAKVPYRRFQVNTDPARR